MSKSEYERIAQRFDTDHGAHVHFLSDTEALVWWSKKPATGFAPRKYWLAHVQIGGNGEGMYFDDTDPDLKLTMVEILDSGETSQ